MRWPWRRGQSESNEYLDAFRRFRWQLPPDRNPVHDWFWPECRLPMPHGHPIGTWSRDDRGETIFEPAESFNREDLP